MTCGGGLLAGGLWVATGCCRFCARADRRVRPGREQVAGKEEGFSEVAGNDFFRVADGREVDAGVPSEEKIDVRRYLLELRLAQRTCSSGAWAQKRVEEFGDTERGHLESLV